jgi:proteasome lid subunit RPN8/RPN11
MDILSGELTVPRAAAGHQSEVNLDNPPHMSGHVVVGVFHTHPNPSRKSKPVRNHEYLLFATRIG